MGVFYSPRYYADIGDRHIFPIRKFELVRDRLLAEGTVLATELFEPEPASRDDVLLVHEEDYVTRLTQGQLSEKELRRLGLPWSPSLVQRSFYAVGGTIAASLCAFSEGVGSNLAGGTHHSFRDRGGGFCVLNDVAIAVRVLQRDGYITRAAVIDCDVHQGNGTATIFEGDEDVFTFSIHGAKNYPLFKAKSNLDIELADETPDDLYLEQLSSALPRIFEHTPDIAFYLAGADPYRGDKLGRLALSIHGLLQRDHVVLKECYRRETPIVTVMSGGYGERLDDTIEIHCNTIRAVRSIFHSAAISENSEQLISR